MNIAIIGENSYIGNNVAVRFAQDADNCIFKVNAKNDSWRDFDFSEIDVLVHTAAIVHNKIIQDWDTYYNVNTLLPVNIAEVAKAAGVKQFIFISTMGVYGADKKLIPNMIDKSTIPMPKSLYGKSKYEAEIALKEIEDESFVVTIVRPPNVYGKDCKGGYISGFASIIKKIPAIPCAYENVRQSVIYIDNLVELIYRLALLHKSGVYMPQDERAVSAVELMSAIADGIGLKKTKSKLLGLGAYILGWTAIAKKAFGGIEYAEELSNIDGIDYRIVSFAEGIRRTVSGTNDIQK